MRMTTYDVIVIGSGGGLKIARPAAAMGKRVALIEEGDVGGTCLLRGCIPSKMLIYPTERADRIRETEKLNVHVPQPPNVDFSALIARINGTISEISASLTECLRKTPNLDVYTAHAAFVEVRVIAVGGEHLTAPLIFIATGSVPSIPPIRGLAGTPFMTNEEALRRTALPESLIVLGASYIAVELGGAYGDAGCNVDFIVRSRFLRREDDEIAAEFARVFGRDHTIHEGYQPLRVEYRDGAFLVHCRNANDEARDLRAEALLVATGVTPATRGLGLENTGIRTDADGFIQVDRRLQTDVAGVYALGDVVGNYLFRHTVNYEGEYLVRTVLGNEPARPLDYGPVPHAVFAHPEVAGVGLTERQARQAGRDVVIGRATYADSNQGLARQSDHGLVKLLFDRADRRLIGAHIVGDDAATMLHMLIVLMKKHGTLDDLLDTIFIHPALPEVARDAARDAAAQL